MTTTTLTRVQVDKPRITSVEDVESALATMTELTTQRDAFQADHERQLRLLNEQLKQELVCGFRDTEPVTYDDQLDLIHDAVASYCDKHRETLSTDERKHCRFGNGTVKWRKAKDAVAYLEDWTHKDSTNVVGKRGGLLGKLSELVKTLNLGSVVSVALKISLTNARKDYDSDTVSARQLRAIGLEYVEGEEYITVEPAEFRR